MQKACFEKTAPLSEDGDDSFKGEVFQVSDCESFIKALGSHRIIRMAPGDYYLSDFRHVKSSIAVWDDAYDGDEMSLSKIENLTIEGIGERPSRIFGQTTIRDCPDL